MKVDIVYWEDEGAWIGYVREFPDCWTEGGTLDDLEEHLRDLYRDLASGEIAAICRVKQLDVR